MSIRSLGKKLVPSKLKPLVQLIDAIPWCDKALSFSLSNKYKCLFIVGPHTNVVIENGAKINIKGQFNFNQPWNGRQVIPANLFVSSSGTLNVLSGFTVYSGGEISVNKDATLTLGSGYMNMRGNIACFNSISIGCGTIISEEVMIRDSNNHTIDRDGYKDNGPVVIGDHIWIGVRSTILQGVTIGNGAIIGAGSLVNKNVPEKTLYAGVPAKCIRENVEWHN